MMSSLHHHQRYTTSDVIAMAHRYWLFGYVALFEVLGQEVFKHSAGRGGTALGTRKSVADMKDSTA